MILFNNTRKHKSSRLSIVVIGLAVLTIAACDANGAAMSASYSDGPSQTMSDASAHGLDPTTVTSQDLCSVLRTVLSDNIFGRPLTSTDVIDYQPGRPEGMHLVMCELATEPIEMSSHPSGGGSYQPAVAEITMGNPYLDDGTPSHHPPSWFLEGHYSHCRGSDEPLLDTTAATIWCLDDTVHGWSVLYFNDLIVTFDMQAPRRMTTELTYTKFSAERDAVLNAIVRG